MTTALRVATAAIVLLPSLLLSQEHQPTPPSQDEIAFREPFTLRIKVDRQHYYQERYEKRIPYVAENDVYLFSDENFGVNLRIDGKNIELTYQPDLKKADVWFSFNQPKELRDGASMMLVIQNKLKRELRIDALMTVPGKKDIYKTSIVPIEAGRSDYES
jgi:hypothetical protein